MANRRCLVKGCDSVDTDNCSSLTDFKVLFHPLPEDLAGLRRWSTAIPGGVQEDSEEYVCCLHFTPEDYEGKGRRKILKPKAIPSKFPESSVKDHSLKITRVTSNAIRSLDQLIERVNRKIFPIGIYETRREEDHLFLRLHEKLPEIDFSLSIHNDLSYSLYKNGLEIPSKEYSNIVESTEVISGPIEVVTLLEFLNDFGEFLPEEAALKKAKNILSLVSRMDLSVSEEKRLTVIIDQLDSVLKRNEFRSYCPLLYTSCVILENSSPTFYRLLLEQDIISIPSVQDICRISGRLFKKSLSESSFPPPKSKESIDNTVSLSICDSFVSKPVHFFEGRMSRVTSEADRIRNLITFVIRGVYSDFAHVIGVVPLNDVNIDILMVWLKNALSVVQNSGYNVSFVIGEGNPLIDELFTNIGLVYSAGGNSMVRTAIHWDPVYALRSLHHHFLMQKKFIIPPTCGTKNDIKKIWTTENLFELRNQTFKYPNKWKHLGPNSLHQLPLERLTHKDWLKLFSSNSIQALKKTGTPSSLAEIFQIFKSISDCVFEEHGDTLPSQLIKSIEWINSWMNLDNKIDTHSPDKTIAIVKRALDSLKSVTCSILQSNKEDPLVHSANPVIPFSKLRINPEDSYLIRSLTGYSYYSEALHSFSGEKRIHAMFLKMYSKIDLSRGLAHYNPSSISGPAKEKIFKEVKCLLRLLSFENLDSNFKLNPEISETLWFVSGYILTSIKNIVDCESCCDHISDQNSKILVELNDDDDKKIFEHTQVKELIKKIEDKPSPSELFYLFTLHAFQFYDFIMGDAATRARFTNHSRPPLLFVFSFVKILDSGLTQELVGIKCALGHDIEEIFKQVAYKLFNIIEHIEPLKSAGVKRKIDAEDVDSVVPPVKTVKENINDEVSV